jgi:hypothetical protein
MSVYKTTQKPSRAEIEWAHHLLVYADDVNLSGDNRYCKENTETLTEASKVYLEVKAERT